VLANLGYMAVLPLGGAPEAATALGRGVMHATQDRVGTAVAEAIFGPGAVAAMAVAISSRRSGATTG
jgi:APA family basic amino acid/polyamine antiporter